MQLLHPGPKTNYGYSSLVVPALHLWNELPFEIREAKSATMFSKKLKTHLFTLDLNLNIHRPSYDELLF